MNETWFKNRQVGEQGQIQTRADFHMLAKAIKQRWPITEQMKKNALKGIASALEENADIKLKLQAAKILAMLDGLNLKEQALYTPKQILHQHRTMSDEEIMNAIRQRLGEMGVPVDVQNLQLEHSPT